MKNNKEEYNSNKADQVKQLFERGHHLHLNKKLDEAAALYSRILNIQPDHVDALHLLGAVALAKGDYDTSIELIEQALSIKPDISGAFKNLAMAFQYKGQWEKSAENYKKFLEFDKDNFQGHFNLGKVREKTGLKKEALESYDAALENRPDHIPVLLRKAGILQALERYDQASLIYEQVLELDPENAQAYHDRAVIFLKFEKDQDAEQSFRKAIELKPDYAEAYNHLGVSLLQQGKMDEAADFLEQAVRLKPDYVKAYYHLMNVNRFPDGTSGLSTLEKLKTGHLEAEDKAFLFFALGKLHEKKGNWNKAFVSYQVGNRARRQEKKSVFNRQEHLNRISVLIRSFTPLILSQTVTSGIEDSRPVFIVGMPRSGTTLTEQILSSHPYVHGAGELKKMGHLVRNYFDPLSDIPLPENLKNFSPDKSGKLASEYLEHINTLSPESARITDKMPFNYLHLGFIYLMFPNAVIVHCRRNPLDTCISCFFQNFVEGNDFSFDLSDLGFYYVCYERLMAHWRSVLPLSMIDVDYEAMVESTEEQIRRLIDFCGLPWDDRCLEFYASKRSVRTASLNQVRKKIYTTSTEKWQRYAGHISPLAREIGDPRSLETARQYQNMGYRDQAALIYDRVRRTFPDNPHAWHLSGLIEHQKGNHPEAAEYIHHAVYLDDSHDLFFANLGLVHKALKNYGDAETAHRKAVEKNQKSVVNRRLLAEILLARGKVEQAWQEVQKALEIEPDNVSTLVLSAGIAARKKQPLQAVQIAARALEKAPDSPEALNMHSILLMDNGQEQRAASGFEKVTDTRPEEAGFYLNFGNALLQGGAEQKARRTFEKCLQMNAGIYGAYYGLSRVKQITKGDPVFRQAENLLENAYAGSSEKSALLYALGSAHDHSREHEKAFSRWQKANELLYRKTAFNSRQEAAKWHHLKRIFTPEITGNIGTDTKDEVYPLFIVGMPGSGKSLLYRMLARLCDTLCLGNTSLMQSIVQAAPAKYGLEKPFPFYAGMLNEKTAKEMKKEYIDASYDICGRKSRSILNKQFYNAYYIGIIRCIMPEARVIYCTRNMLDMCLAVYTAKYENDMPFHTNVREIAQMDFIYNDLMKFWKTLFPDMIVTVDYESVFHKDPETLALIFNHAGMDTNGKTRGRTALDIDVTTVCDRQFGPGCSTPYEPFLKPLLPVSENETL